MRWHFWCRLNSVCRPLFVVGNLETPLCIYQIRIISRRAIKGGNETVVREGRECSITITCVIETVASASRHKRRQNPW